MTTTRWLIGLSSGSTVDGVDAALLEISGNGLEARVAVAQTIHHPYPRELRELLVKAATPSTPTPTRQLAQLHRVLGETYAAAARQGADQAGVSLSRVLAVGCQGHTVWHEPEGRLTTTLSLGMAPVIAERTGLTVVSDFRSRDLAAGGQGMPLTALADHLLFQHPQEHRALLHLGGMASLVHLPAGRGLRQVLGFQTGPCNLLLDGLMSQLTGGREPFDSGGKHAVQGRCIESLLQRWLEHPTLQRRPPRIIPRHEFAEDFVLATLRQARQNAWSLHDVLCTATHFIARHITGALRRWVPQLPQRILLSGGGMKNGLLWHLLEQQLTGCQLDHLETLGVPSRARKAVVFGVLAALTLDGVPGSLTAVTGASGARLLGSLTPGSPANWARCLHWMAHHTSIMAAAA